MTKGMVRITSGRYIVIIGEKKMIEVWADSIEEAKQIVIEAGYTEEDDGQIVACKIPHIIGYIK